jgi:NAD(P)-dependent dehydrogenase (short-subunit alcohol dehydrogenase family)
MTGETWIVTGAGRGIGLSLVHTLDKRGSRVIAGVRRPGEAVSRLPERARVEALDVADAASVEAFARRLEGTPVDALVNNAGIGGEEEDLERLDVEGLLDYFRVNSLGPLRLVRALLPLLRKGRRKLVVNVTSRMGSLAQNEGGGYYGYRSSKAALNMITRNLALELGPEGFTCVAVHPGWVRTRMGGPGAPLSPRESAVKLVDRVAGLGGGDNGGFLSTDGTRIPW